MNDKPTLSFWQIWNMCFGFLGIQFGFALQNANVSRIFQTLGAQMDELAVLWIAAPLTGLIVQPIIGHFSDKTWTGLGRRRPYFLAGAVLTTFALFFMPNSPTLWIAAGMLWIMDASINISMEPFRALVGDQLGAKQRSSGFAMQSFFIGIGSVVASLLPYVLAKYGVANTAEPGMVPDTVKYSFYAGGAVLMLAVGWTVLRTKEYTPEQLRRFAANDTTCLVDDHKTLITPKLSVALLWVIAGAALLSIVYFMGLDKQLYLLGAGIGAYGVLVLITSGGHGPKMIQSIMSDLHNMPNAMRQLALVQFFSLFALFAVWIYTTPAVTQVHFGSSDTSSLAYNEGANWVSLLFAAYNGFAALAALVIPLSVRWFGLRFSHLLNVSLGGAALLSIALIRDPNWLLLPMIGFGFAWASILSLPYALLANSLPAEKMGVYMGIFNFFIVVPQLLAASVLGFLLKMFFNNEPIYALIIGGVSMILSGLLVLRLPRSVATTSHDKPNAAEASCA